MQVKALALFSGGLDSALSAKVILDQGVQVEAVHFINAFLAGRKGKTNIECSLQKRQASQLGIKLHILDISKAHLEMVQSPVYGYGSHMNPCIDCRILMLKEARSYMQTHGFSFLISGEVLGQRPMSQRRDALNIIDRNADVKGLVLRPLSAKLFNPSVAEEAGWVDRDKLFAFSGRSRKPQLALAEKLGIKEYSTPAGGCLLTEAEFSRRFKDLLAQGAPGLNEVQLLKVGRHFRYPDLGKIIVGRDEQENGYLANLAEDRDILFKMRDFSGPLTVACPVRNQRFFNGARQEANGNNSTDSKPLIEAAAALTARYGRGKDNEKVWLDYWPKILEEKKSIQVTPATEALIEKLRI